MITACEIRKKLAKKSKAFRSRLSLSNEKNFKYFYINLKKVDKLKKHLHVSLKH